MSSRRALFNSRRRNIWSWVSSFTIGRQTGQEVRGGKSVAAPHAYGAQGTNEMRRALPESASAAGWAQEFEAGSLSSTSDQSAILAHIHL